MVSARKKVQSSLDSPFISLLGLDMSQSHSLHNVVSDEDLASAFIGVLQKSHTGEFWRMFVTPYVKSGSGQYELVARPLKTFYTTYVLHGSWSGMKFLVTTAYLLEHFITLSHFQYDKVGRLYELGRLPLGKMSGLSMDCYNEIESVFPPAKRTDSHTSTDSATATNY